MLTTKNFVTFSKKCYMRVSFHEKTTTAPPPATTTTTTATTTPTATTTSRSVEICHRHVQSIFSSGLKPLPSKQFKPSAVSFFAISGNAVNRFNCCSFKNCNSLKMWNVGWVFWQHLWHLLGYNCVTNPLKMFEFIGLWNSRALSPPLLGC